MTEQWLIEEYTKEEDM